MTEGDRENGKRPIFCMKDESTGCRFARAVEQKGVGEEKEVEWLVFEACAELKAWGHPGGEGNRIILKFRRRIRPMRGKRRDWKIPWRKSNNGDIGQRRITEQRGAE